MTVEKIMTKQVISVRPDTNVKEVARLLFTQHLTGVPVIDADEKLVGIITEGDIVIRNAHVHMPQVIQILDSFIYPTGVDEMEAEMEKITAVEARQLMTSSVVTIAQDASVEDLATLMTEQHVNPVPVVDNAGRVVGIVSRSDLVALVAQEKSGK